MNFCVYIGNQKTLNEINKIESFEIVNNAVLLYAEEIKVAKNLGINVLYILNKKGNKEDDLFQIYDDLEIVGEPQGCKYFFRGVIGSYESSKELLKKNNLENIIKDNKLDNIWHWYRYVEEKWTGRQIIELDKQTLSKWQFDKKYFVKTIDKYGAEVIESTNQLRTWLAGVNKYKGRFLLSEYLDLEKESVAGVEPLEWRVYVLNSKIASISEFNFNSHDNSFEGDIIRFSKDFIYNNEKDFGSNYILDIMKTVQGGYVISELNPYYGAGRYKNNKFENVLKAII